MSENYWIAFGLIGQMVFMGRFVVQWLSSERRGRSVIPVAFWYLSLLGGGMLLVYAIHKRDPVFMLGQSLGSFIYLRNLQLISKERRRQAGAGATDSAVADSQSSRPSDAQPPALRSAG